MSYLTRNGKFYPHKETTKQYRKRKGIIVEHKDSNFAIFFCIIVFAMGYEFIKKLFF